MKIVNLFFDKKLISITLLAMLFSCDFSTHEYYSFEDPKENFYLGWNTNSECYTSFHDELEFNFDNVILFFPNDSSTINSTSEGYYQNIYEDDTVIVDSVLVLQYYFEFPENDPRVLSNDSLIMFLNLGTETIHKETLRRKKREEQWIERIPLPRIGC